MNKALKQKWLSWFASKDCAKFSGNPPGSVRYFFSQSYDQVFLRPWIDEESQSLVLSNESQQDLTIDLDMIEKMSVNINNGHCIFAFPYEDSKLRLAFFSLESAAAPSWAAEEFDE